MYKTKCSVRKQNLEFVRKLAGCFENIGEIHITKAIAKVSENEILDVGYLSH